jgi:aspartate 1-decarboxylase
MKVLLKSKIHLATITDSKKEYIGSITIDKELMDLVGIVEEEKVLVTSFDSGNRLETYVISGEAGSGKVEMNGPTANLIKKGEKVVIMAFEVSDNLIKSKKILVDENNKFIRYL